MPSQQLLLSWKDHNGALVSVFENLLKRNTLVDCTLAADGQYLKAHKVVLSACSSYFELLFSQESEKNPIVILKDVKFQELEAAVNFMYRGEVEVCEDRLAAFLEVADSLQIKGLGSDGKSQDYKGKSPPLKSSKTAAPPKQHSRKEAANTHSENTGESSITLDSDQNSNNESSSHHQQPHRETSGSSPIPSTLAIASSFSIASASTSCPVRPETHGDQDKLENNQCSSPTVSTFPSGETVPSDVNTVIKTEPVTDTYLDEKSDETERDFDDVTMMEDQEDWDDPNIESMGDDHANQHDPDYSATHMKTEESASENMAGAPSVEHVSSEDVVWVEGGDRQHFTSVFFKEQPPDVLVPDPDLGFGGGGGGGGGRQAGGDHGAASATAVLRQPATGFDRVYHRGASDHVLISSLGRSALDVHAGRLTPYDSTHTSTSYQKAFDRLSDSNIRTKTHLRGTRGRMTEFSYITNVSSDLSKHKRLHSGERPFKCPRCIFTTEVHSRLVVHMRTHTGEKPFKCPECNYAGSDQGNFQRHRRIHTGERPYKCSDCLASFTQSNSLKRHKRNCVSSRFQGSKWTSVPIHDFQEPFRSVSEEMTVNRSGSL